MLVTLENIKAQQPIYSIIRKRRVMGNNRKNKYVLLHNINVLLSNGKEIRIPSGFEWDLSSTPRIFWSIVPPDGDFELGALIHDFLYVNRKNPDFKEWNTRKFADKEMLIWSKVTSGTKGISLRNLDNWIRYIFVRLLGWTVWNNYIKLK